ncbi:hypothetical protein ACQY0O_006109 [Thecaphora frezii]
MSVLRLGCLSLALLAPYAAAAPSKNCRCPHLEPAPIPGVRFTSSIATPTTTPYLDPLTNQTHSIRYCEYNVTLTHSGHDNVTVTTYLPPNRQWNGRFQGTGGGGYIAGKFAIALVPAVAQGYAASSTDAGVGFNETGDFLLAAPGKLDTTLLENFAHRSIHEMTLVGKDLVRQFYRKSPRHSYFVGCSTGGRQAMMSVQRYPDDYDGLIANSPAIDWARLLVSNSASITARRLKYDQPTCELLELRRRAVAACDALDGKVDGIVAAFDRCHFDARSVVGKTFVCGETKATMRISEQAAEIANAAWQGLHRSSGQRVYYGLGYDSNITVVSGQDNTYSLLSDGWIKYAVEKNVDFDPTTLDVDALADAVRKSSDEFGHVIGTYNADLLPAAKRGVKLLTVHGMADQAIPLNTTIEYYDHVRAKLREGNFQVDDVYRLFLAQGAEHCGGGPGAWPQSPLDQLVQWVEQEQPPKHLPAQTSAGEDVALCKYPLLPRYKAGGWTCHAQKSELTPNQG